MFSALVTAPVVEVVSHVLQSRDVHRNQTALVWPDPTGTKSLVSRSAEYRPMTLRAVAKNARHHDRCVADNPSTAPGATEDGWTCHQHQVRATGSVRAVIHCGSTATS